MPDLVTLTGYAVTVAFGLFALFWLFGGFIENTKWFWFGKYVPQLLNGLWITVQLLVFSLVVGFLLAIPVGLVQVNGPRPLAWLAKGYCTVIRGTPLLLQLYMLYYGLGSLFQSYPEIRQSFLWPVLREGYYYGFLALTLSVIGYEGEIMRGAFLAVPKGELEAARAFGMSRTTLLRRIWLPRAIRTVLPTLGGEVISQLKSTPVVSTVTVYDLFGVATKIRQETLRVYEPLLLAAVSYFIVVYILSRIIARIEAQVPQKR
ncbi:MAG: ABC transporter permease subunit [Alphaproteobacteria bacterium]|nr:ABC transporter permease subunit [Alphaproteobacteria bacterium]